MAQRLGEPKAKKSEKPDLAGKNIAIENAKRLTSAEQKRLNDGLLDAAWNNKLDGIKRLLDLGADVEATDHDGNTALSWAARWGHTEICAFLIEKGADVKKRGWKNWSALDWAESNKRHETMAFLRFAGSVAPRIFPGNMLYPFYSNFMKCVDQ
jgi:ankyrin repeat protein